MIGCVRDACHCTTPGDHEYCQFFQPHRLEPELYDRAARIYGFAVMPDIVTLSRRQLEILDGIVEVLKELRDLKVRFGVPA